MNLNFELSDLVWWRPSYFSYTNREFVNLIEKYNDKIRTYLMSNSDTFEYEFRLVYLKDCLLGERNIRMHSTSDIEEILQAASLLPVSRPKEQVCNSKIQVKEKTVIVNMFNTIQSIFPSLHLPELEIGTFTVDLANRIHQLICAGLADNPGTFRRSEAKPVGENFHYLAYDQIPCEIKRLFKNTRREIDGCKGSPRSQKIEKLIKIGSQFLNTFLYIHPYSNGNGRTARILVSYLMSSISIVPISLTEGTRQETYLRCLQEIHANGRIDHPPVALATLLLERVFYSLEFYYKYFVL